MRMRWLVALMVLVQAQAALAKEKKPEAPVATPAAKPVDKDALTLKRLVDALRTAIKASAKDDADLASLLLDAVAETSLATVIHGHYALAGVGQALRSGGMGADDTRAYAKDMAQNWQALSQMYNRLGGHKAFDPELRNIFQSLALMTEKAAQTAGLLANWAELTSDNSRAAAFEAALEDYRGRVKAFVATVQGK
jgi:hypothetical protein